MSNRDKNRADFPSCTEAFDMIRATCPEARVLWASENGNEIGKRPELDPNHFEISGESYEMACRNVAARGRK